MAPGYQLREFSSFFFLRTEYCRAQSGDTQAQLVTDRGIFCLDSNSRSVQKRSAASSTRKQNTGRPPASAVRFSSPVSSADKVFEGDSADSGNLADNGNLISNAQRANA